MADRETVRAFLDADPIGNAVVWDRVFQQGDFRVYVEGEPPRALIAMERARRPGGANFIALHATDPDAAGALCDLVPSGFTILHLTEEFPLALLEPRAYEFHPHSAWLFRLEPGDFVDHPDERVRPLEPQWAGRVATLWQPDWPAEGYVCRRIEAGPTAAIYADGEPVAWALTHMVTDRVGIIGMVHVLDGYRRKGLARSVVAAVSRDLVKLGKIPTLHAFVDNPASLALFPTLGFRRVKRQVWGDAVFR
ncbi:MAG: GNAT family N-acetyltransferase [Thermoplasmata archaeon]